MSHIFTGKTLLFNSYQKNYKKYEFTSLFTQTSSSSTVLECLLGVENTRGVKENEIISHFLGNGMEAGIFTSLLF